MPCTRPFDITLQLVIAAVFIAQGGVDDSSESDIALFVVSAAVALFHAVKCIWAWVGMRKHIKIAVLGENHHKIDSHAGYYLLPTTSTDEELGIDMAYTSITDKTDALKKQEKQLTAKKKATERNREKWKAELAEIKEDAQAQGKTSVLEDLADRVQGEADFLEDALKERQKIQKEQQEKEDREYDEKERARKREEKKKNAWWRRLCACGSTCSARGLCWSCQGKDEAQGTSCPTVGQHVCDFTHIPPSAGCGVRAARCLCVCCGGGGVGGGDLIVGWGARLFAPLASCMGVASHGCAPAPQPGVRAPPPRVRQITMAPARPPEGSPGGRRTRAQIGCTAPDCGPRLVPLRSGGARAQELPLRINYEWPAPRVGYKAFALGGGRRC